MKCVDRGYTVKTTALKALGRPEKTNSSYGNYAILVQVRHEYNNGEQRIDNQYIYYFTLKKAREIYNELANGNILIIQGSAL